MKRYHILGHSNSILSMMIETLYALYKNKVDITLIKNMQTEDSTPYKIDDIKLTEIFHDQWTPRNEDKFLLGVFRCQPKRIVYEFFLENYAITENRYASLIHPQTTIASTALLSEGVFINPQVVISPFAALGKFVSINRHVSIGHHTNIGDFSTINPGCHIAGKCKIGKNVMIGIGATIIDNIEIGDNAIIGAGSVVTKSVSANTVVYGVPAKEIRKVE